MRTIRMGSFRWTGSAIAALAGTALSQYLATSPGSTRTDVRKEPLCVRACCAPDRIPSGR